MTVVDEPVPFEVPRPSMAFVIGALLLYLLLVTEVAPRIGVDVEATAMVPVHGVLALTLYVAMVVAASHGSPLVWYDRAKFERYLDQLNPDWRAVAGSKVEAVSEHMRALSWRDGTVAIAQQVGFVTGAGAGMTFLQRSWPLALLIYAVVGLTVGLIAKALIGAHERDAMEARLTT